MRSELDATSTRPHFKIKSSIDLVGNMARLGSVDKALGKLPIPTDLLADDLKLVHQAKGPVKLLRALRVTNRDYFLPVDKQKVFQKYEDIPPMNIKKSKAEYRKAKKAAKEKFLPLSPSDMAEFLALDPTNTEALQKIIKHSGKLTVLLFTIAVILRSMGTAPIDAGIAGEIFQKIVFNANASIPLFKLPMKDAENLSPETLSVVVSWLSALSLGGFFSKFFPNGIKMAQDNIRSQIEKGEGVFEPDEGYTAAFVGKSDKTADTLQQQQGLNDMVQISSEPLGLRVWQLIRNYDDETKVFEALDRIQFAKAGETMLFPLIYQDMFLPDPAKGHDMSYDEIKKVIEVCDNYCAKNNIPKKPVFIVGSSNIGKEYVAGSERKFVSIDTMRLKLNTIREKNGEPLIRIVDPDELVMAKVYEIADGRRLELSSDTEGYERYNPRFLDLVEPIIDKKTGERKKQTITRKDTVFIRYHINDLENESDSPLTSLKTEVNIVLNAKAKQALIKRGVAENHIIVVEDLVINKLVNLACNINGTVS